MRVGCSWLFLLTRYMCETQVAYRERQEEEPGGDPHASYAYAAANAGAKAAGTELGAEVPWHPMQMH